EDNTRRTGTAQPIAPGGVGDAHARLGDSRARARSFSRPCYVTDQRAPGGRTQWGLGWGAARARARRAKRGPAAVRARSPQPPPLSLFASLGLSPPFVKRSEQPGPCCLAMADEKPKEGVKTENNDHINLKVAGQDGSVVQFKIKRHTPLNKLMKAYCERQGLSMRQIRFRFDGQPINETDTPAQLEMEDEDTIDVFQQQTGGVY
uniref:Ubiquitin-like domain-containing protein n=2 Tax=Testudinoidea TaxID=8486 RepID=A0A8C4YMX2_9SAUR